MSRLRRIASTLASALFDLLCAVVPRKRSLWVIGGNRGLRYADNSMHFFRHCMGRKDVDVAWLAREASVVRQVRAEGGRAHLVGSLAGIWLGLRASWHVHDVSPSDTGPGARSANRMNLWHGIPLKDIAFVRAGVMARRRASRGSGRDYVVHPNRLVDPILHAFDIGKDFVVTANLPRNCVFEPGYEPLRSAKVSDRPWVDRLMSLRSSGTRVIGYFPTWRGNGKDLFLGTADAHDIQALGAFLAAKKLALATKWHTCSFREYRHAGASKTAAAIDNAIRAHPAFVSLPFDVDLNSMLPACDLLVTDYSSVFFDFALGDRPQLFLPYDLEHYVRSVGFVHDYASVVPGPIVRTIDAFRDEIDAYASDPVTYAARHAAARASIRSTFFETRASSRSIADFMAALEPAPDRPGRHR